MFNYLFSFKIFFLFSHLQGHQKKKKRSLTIVGNGKQTRDFIHVDDLTNAFIKLARSNLKNKIYNLGSGKETSINKIANIIGFLNPSKKISKSSKPKENVANAILSPDI